MMIARKLHLQELKPIKQYSPKDPRIQILSQRMHIMGTLTPLIVTKTRVILDGNKRYAVFKQQKRDRQHDILVVEVDVPEHLIWPAHSALNAKLDSFADNFDTYLDPYLENIRTMITTGTMSVSVIPEIEESESVGNMLRALIDDELNNTDLMDG